MTIRRHEQIQRYADGQTGVEEAAALQAAMKKDPELRALYLDYMNLDEALNAVAGGTAIAEIETGTRATCSRPPSRKTPRYWRWLAGAAVCASAVAFVMLFRDGIRPQPRLDVDAACSSTQAAIARISIGPPSFPSWMSPTASMLDQSYIAKGEP
jgi:hypothetical protein